MPGKSSFICMVKMNGERQELEQARLSNSSMDEEKMKRILRLLLTQYHPVHRIKLTHVIAAAFSIPRIHHQTEERYLDLGPVEQWSATYRDFSRLSTKHRRLIAQKSSPVDSAAHAQSSGDPVSSCDRFQSCSPKPPIV